MSLRDGMPFWAYEAGWSPESWEFYKDFRNWHIYNDKMPLLFLLLSRWFYLVLGMIIGSTITTIVIMFKIYWGF